MESYVMLLLVGSAAFLVSWATIRMVDAYLAKRRARRHRAFLRKLRVYSMV